MVPVAAMKNADHMLRAIIALVDTNGDGKIQFDGRFRLEALDEIGVNQRLRVGALEFRVFVETAERQLLMLFQSIDRDKDGRLNKEELRTAFQRAGLSVPMRRLSGFFDEIDLNNDGFISFDEWR